MTHESDNSIGCLVTIECIELLGNRFHIFLSILQQGHTELQGYSSQIGIVEVAIGIVGEVLDVVDNAGVLLAGNHLQRLDNNLLILHTLGSKGVEPEGRCIVVAGNTVLTGSSTVDTDG